MSQDNYPPHIMPYGVAISDAIKRGDKAEMQALLERARTTQGAGDLTKAIQDLENAIKAK